MHGLLFVIDESNDNVDIKQMIMFTSDGVAVMLGCNNGVHVKLREM